MPVKKMSLYLLLLVSISSNLLSCDKAQNETQPVRQAAVPSEFEIKKMAWKEDGIKEGFFSSVEFVNGSDDHIRVALTGKYTDVYTKEDFANIVSETYFKFTGYKRSINVEILNTSGRLIFTGLYYPMKSSTTETPDASR